MEQKFDAKSVRKEFPSLLRKQDGKPVVFFDGPGGSQVPQCVMDAVTGCFLDFNTNTEGAFEPSRKLDKMLAEARAAFADFFNAPSSGEGAVDEFHFGANMTTHTFNVSRSIGSTLGPGDEVLVTVLDHEANSSPWYALRERNVQVQTVDINPENCTLNMADFESKLSERTKVVAVGLASNAVGTINDVKSIAGMAHSVGALVYADAVHYVPHGPVDVQALDVDFLVCSAYKMFGPHGVGILYGRKEVVERLPKYKVRPCAHPKFEGGTQNIEGIAGALAALQYLSSIGERFGAPYEHMFPGFSGQRLTYKVAMAAIREYETKLFKRLVTGLSQVPGLKIWGIDDLEKFQMRVPTLAFRVEGFTPQAIAAYLGDQGIYVWDGDFYAQALIERLDLYDTGGVVRVGLTHYNTEEEVDRIVECMFDLVKGR